MIDRDTLYPLLFEPVYKQVMWGGNKLEKILGRTIPAETGRPVGEAWEICDRPDVSSKIENGTLKGTTLRKLINECGSEIVGGRWNGGQFPLLVKIIDAGKRLSLQVHPDENACSLSGGKYNAKTEMWYILAADRGAKIIAGLRKDTTKMQFLNLMSSQEVERTLQIFDSIPGDAYFINAGRVHSIGSGNLLLEIQQNSDTTFRISDWGRVGADGKSRELHVEEACSCIDFMDRTVPRITGVSNTSGHNRKYPIINRCPFFKVEDLRLAETWHDDTASSDSFHLLTSVDRKITVGRDGFLVEVPPGRTCLIPAVFGKYFIAIPAGEHAAVVKTTL